MPLISVIVPVYNTEKYLRRCVDSVLEQDFSDYELILVNDGSTDNSGGLCDYFLSKDSRVRVIHKNNGGLSDARNTGLKSANGKYVIFLDSDDWWEKETLSYFSTEIINDDSLDVVMGHHCSINQSINKRNIPYIFNKKHFNKKGTSVLQYILKKYPDYGFGAVFYLIRRDLILKNSLFFKEGYISEDVFWTPYIFNLAKKISYIDKAFYNYRIGNSASITGNINTKRTYYRMLAAVYNYNKFVELDVSEKLKQLMYRHSALLYFKSLMELAHLPVSDLDNKIKENIFLLKYADTGKSLIAKLMILIFGFEIFLKIIRRIAGKKLV